MSPLYCILYVAFLCSLQTISAAPGGFTEVDATREELVAALNAVSGDIRARINEKYPGNPGIISQPEAALYQVVSNGRRYQITFSVSVLNLTQYGTTAPPKYFKADITASGGPDGLKYRLNDVAPTKVYEAPITG